MRGISRITYLWPGLSRLWHAGDLGALVTAIAFALLLNLVMWGSFISPGGVWFSWRGAMWALVVLFWAAGVWQAARHRASLRELSPAPDQEGLFTRAQAEYLQGHWVEAQALLEQLIRRDPRDLESHLLLASVYRRSQRLELSRQELCHIRQHDGAARWRFEIDRELALLEQVAARAAQQS